MKNVKLIVPIISLVCAAVVCGAVLLWAPVCAGPLELANGNMVPMRCAYTAKVAVLLALVLAAVALGAYRGWSGERRQALETFTENTALRDYLEERSMDAANLRVVAARHLDREDEDLAALTQVRKTLTDPEATVEELAAADAELTRLAARLQQELPQLASVQQSSRDQAYITTLTRTLLAAQSVTDSYNAQVESFNRRLEASLTGKLAQLLGVQPLTAYETP